MYAAFLKMRKGVAGSRLGKSVIDKLLHMV